MTHYADSGMYRPPENEMFILLFKKRIDEWDISDTISDLDYSDDLLIPDFVLKRKTDQKIVGLEILWNWNTVMVERRIKDMGKLKLQKYVLAVADKGNLGKEKLEQIPNSVYLFKSTPLPQEIQKSSILFKL